MYKYRIGVYYSVSGPTYHQLEVENWFRTDLKEMFEWVMENAKNEWKLEILSHSFPEAEPTKVYSILINLVYEDERHAVLHKLRWG